MTILALDTSSKAAGCALLRDGALAGEFFVNAAPTHTETILPMVRTMLRRAAVPMEAVDAYAVSVGPGSFTGLRIGIAAVKGMAMAMNKPCIAVSTLEGLAENLAVFSGVAVPVMDARRAQVYTARFACRDGRLFRESDDTAMAVEVLRERLAEVSEPVMLVGDCAAQCGAAMADLPHIRIAPETLRHQRAGSVAVAAARLAEKGALCTAAELAPTYLRLPQAERERLAKLER